MVALNDVWISSCSNRPGDCCFRLVVDHCLPELARLIMDVIAKRFRAECCISKTFWLSSRLFRVVFQLLCEAEESRVRSAVQKVKLTS